jgi:FkbM family methyltransferase
MTRVRFDFLVHSTMRYLGRGGDQLDSKTQLVSSPPEQQSPELPRGDNQLLSMAQPASSLPEHDPLASLTEGRFPPPEQRFRAGIKNSLRFLLRPLKPIGRPVAQYVRRYFVGDIEISTRASQGLLSQVLSLAEAMHARQAALETHQANLETGQATLETRQATLETRQATLEQIIQGLSHTALGISGRLERALELVQQLHTKVDDVGLRSRGVVPIDANTVALRTYDGFVFVPRSDHLLLVMLLDAGPGGLEPGTRRILTKFLSPGMTFVDVGAHIGILTLAGARAVGPTGKVLAIEPGPAAFEALRRTIEVSGLAGRIKALRQAAGAHQERRTFYVRNVLGHSSLTPSDSHSEASSDEIEVELSPLDDLLPVGERVDLVKIDVEGAELAVLAGMQRIIAENPYLVVIAEFGPSHLRATNTDPEYWFSSFRNQGFEPLVIDELSGRCRPIDMNELIKIESVNILFARKPATLSRALQ